MSLTDEEAGARERSLGEFPEFELECRFDDPDDPGTISLVPGDDAGNVTTSWITADVDYAIPLDEVL